MVHGRGQLRSREIAPNCNSNPNGGRGGENFPQRQLYGCLYVWYYMYCIYILWYGIMVYMYYMYGIYLLYVYMYGIHH